MEKPRIIFGVAFSIFFIGMILVLVGVLLAKDGTKTDPEKPDILPWWKTEIIYQIYPRSFKDSDGDGVGDINGITEKVDYLHDLGIGCVWLNPIYPSPMKDFGYDISNYISIDPLFGTLEDFENLLDKLHEKGIKLVMDFVPNHSSDEHRWFIEALAGNPNYRDYYIWKMPNGTNDNGSAIAPNNWESVFTGSAWNCSAEEDECYYHAFLSGQPDLNYRSQKLRDEMLSVLKFWLDLDVDGFRIDAVKYLIEDDRFMNNPVIISDDGTEMISDTYTTDQPETFVVIRDWRHTIDQYDDKLMMVEVYDNDIDILMQYYGNDTDPLAQFPFNFLLISNLQDREALTGNLLHDVITEWLDSIPEGKWPNWVIGNHDQHRIGSRLKEDLIDAFNMILLLLPGTPVTYYGEEIGMTDTWISFEDTQDPQGIIHGPEDYMKYSRDPERTPMQWDNSSLAGFSTATKPWIPINENYTIVNVDFQEVENESHLKIYRELANLRRKDVFLKGNLAFPHTVKNIISFLRYNDTEAYLIIINLSEDDLQVNLHHQSNFKLPDTGTLVLRSINSDVDADVGEEISLDDVTMLSGVGMVIKFMEEAIETDEAYFNNDMNRIDNPMMMKNMFEHK